MFKITFTFVDGSDVVNADKYRKIGILTGAEVISHNDNEVTYETFSHNPHNVSANITKLLEYFGVKVNNSNIFTV